MPAGVPALVYPPPYTPGYTPSMYPCRYVRVSVSALCVREDLSRHGFSVRFVMALLLRKETVAFAVIHDAYPVRIVSLSPSTKWGSP